MDEQGLPIRLSLSAGQASDKAAALALLDSLNRTAHIVVARGHDAKALVERITSRGAEAHIPPRETERFSAPSTATFTGSATSSNATSTNSNTSDASQPASKSWP